MQNKKENISVIFLFIFCLLLTFVLFPVCIIFANSKQFDNQVIIQNIITSIPYIPLGSFFMIWIIRIIKDVMKNEE